jgi:muramoyltetrapeptide carboxypeptidase
MSSLTLCARSVTLFCMPLIPKKLKKGSHIRVIAPSRSLSIISKDHRSMAKERLEALGLQVSFARHVEEIDEFKSSSIVSRIEDLHQAYSDSTVDGILTVIGGFNSNQLLKFIDYDLIRKNPKILCGYSDITVLQNSILAKADVVTYSGPHFSTFAIKHRLDFTVEYFQKCLFQSDPFEFLPSAHWSDDAWYSDQDNRDFIPNTGFSILNEGEAEGRIVGGNLCTLNLLQGTEFMPSLKNAILLLEDDEMVGSFTDVEVDRNLQSLAHLPDFAQVRGLVFGRFQKKSEMSASKLKKIVSSKGEFKSLPIICGADFGHTDPLVTFPVGGQCRISAFGSSARIEILKH